MGILMSETITINLLDEAIHLHSVFYNLDIPHEHKYRNVEGYQVEALSIQEILRYLYIGVKDRSGSILVWAKADTKNRIAYMTNNTHYRRALPDQLELLAIDIIDATINEHIRGFVYSEGSQYSVLLFEQVSDSLNIGVGGDIRIIEWEEACHKGKIKPAWLNLPTFKSSYRVESVVSSDDEYTLTNYLGLVSDNPAEVNAAILNDPTTH